MLKTTVRGSILDKKNIQITWFAVVVVMYIIHSTEQQFSVGVGWLKESAIAIDYQQWPWERCDGGNKYTRSLDLGGLARS